MPRLNPPLMVTATAVVILSWPASSQAQERLESSDSVARPIHIVSQAQFADPAG